MFELTIKMGDKLVQKYRGNKELVNIGRDPQCDVVLDNLGVSRRHAQIRKVGERFVLADTQSTNGVFIGDRRISSIELQPGDSFKIGKFSLRFEPAAAPAEQFDPHQTIALNAGAMRGAQERSSPQYVASVSRPVFHDKDCNWIQATPEMQKIFFESVEDAVASGRRPCRTCIPSVPDQARAAEGPALPDAAY